MLKKFIDWLLGRNKTPEVQAPQVEIVAPTITESIEPVGLKNGSKGSDVKALQADLHDLGIDVGAADGVFGQKTEAGVKAAQEKYGLPVTGVADETLLAAIRAEKEKPKPKPEELGLPTREQVLKALIGMIEGNIKTKCGAYKLIRETKGNNRSPEIDKLIKAQGGSLGEPYCQYGQQEVLDELCRYYNVERKLVQIPEGGSTQTVWSLVPDKYKVEGPKPMCWVTWQHGTSYRGHVEMCLTDAVKTKYQTFGFNTSVTTDDKVVRDGQGAGYMDRRTGTIGDMRVKGYTDIYEALIDAMVRAA